MKLVEWMRSIVSAWLLPRTPDGLAETGDHSRSVVEAALAKLDRDQEDQLIGELFSVFASYQDDYPTLKARGFFQIDLARAVPDAERAQELDEISIALSDESTDLADACEISDANMVLREALLASAIRLALEPGTRKGEVDAIDLMARAWGDVECFYADVVPFCLKKLDAIRSDGG